MPKYCEGKTKLNEQCKILVYSGNKFCRHHKEKTIFVVDLCPLLNKNEKYKKLIKKLVITSNNRGKSFNYPKSVKDNKQQKAYGTNIDTFITTIIDNIKNKKDIDISKILKDKSLTNLDEKICKEIAILITKDFYDNQYKHIDIKDKLKDENLLINGIPDLILNKNEIIDYKVTCENDYDDPKDFTQLLIYAVLYYKIKGIKIEKLTVYNPLKGKEYNIDLKDWDKFDELYSIIKTLKQ